VRDTEVGDQRPAAPLLHEDVVRLHVPVDDALGVRVRECPGDLTEKSDRLLARKRSPAADPLTERPPVDVRHREEDEVADLVDRVDRHDVGVRQLGRRARLTEKALPECRLGRELGGQELQRHGPVERDLVRKVDDPHPAAADLPLEGVPSDERLLKGEKVGIWGVTHC